MKKITVITGKEESGKSFLSRNIAFAFNKPIYLNCIDGHHAFEDRFLFRQVDSSTDLIVLEEVDKDWVSKFVFKCYENIVSEDQGKAASVIPSPKIVIVSEDFNSKNLDDSYKRRISIIETTIDDTGDKRIFNAKRID